MYCLVVFLIFKDFLQAYEAVSSSLGKFAPPPGIRAPFFAPEQGIRQKICLGGRDSLAQKNFPGGCPVYPIGIDWTLNRIDFFLGMVLPKDNRHQPHTSLL